LLLEHAKEKNPADKAGETPLHLAALYGQLETVKLLLEHAKDKNPADNEDTTPLHWAAESGHLEIVKLLLEHAKDKNPADNEDMTPLHLAEQRGHVEIVKLIKDFNKDKKIMKKYIFSIKKAFNLSNLSKIFCIFSPIFPFTGLHKAVKWKLSNCF
jgi:ankyrin repeat protein